MEHRDCDNLVGAVAIRYNGIASWPAIRTTCKMTRAVLEPFWKAARSSPRDGITSIGSKCDTCGWWSGAYESDQEACDICCNIGCCWSLCSYLAADGSRYCVQCDAQPGAPPYKFYYDAVMDIVGNQLDYLQLCGVHFSRRRLLPCLWSRYCCFLTCGVDTLFNAWRAHTHAPGTPRSLQPAPYTWLQVERIPPMPTRSVPWPPPAWDTRPHVNMRRTVAYRTVPDHAVGLQEEEDALHGTATPPCVWTFDSSEGPPGTTVSTVGFHRRSDVTGSEVDAM